MNRPRVSLYEFVPYGAPELLEVGESYLTRALATASSGLVVLFAIGVAGSSAFDSVAEAKLTKGESMRVGYYTLVYRSLDERTGANATEIRATLAAAREGFGTRTIVVFQPHRYSRTKALLEEFGEALP